MSRIPALATLSLIALIVAVPAQAAKPPICRAAKIQQILIDAGKLTQSEVDEGMIVSQVRCGDVTADGVKDAVFGVASGGTAGQVRFGVVRGGAREGLVDYRRGYKVSVARRSRRAYEVLQPIYADDDANCCPSSFRITTYRWKAGKFTAAGSKRVKNAPDRFVT